MKNTKNGYVKFLSDSDGKEYGIFTRENMDRIGVGDEERAIVIDHLPRSFKTLDTIVKSLKNPNLSRKEKRDILDNGFFLHDLKVKGNGNFGKLKELSFLADHSNIHITNLDDINLYLPFSKKNIVYANRVSNSDIFLLGSKGSEFYARTSTSVLVNGNSSRNLTVYGGGDSEDLRVMAWGSKGMKIHGVDRIKKVDPLAYVNEKTKNLTFYPGYFKDGPKGKLVNSKKYKLDGFSKGIIDISMLFM